MAATEASVRSRVEARGWTLEKAGKVYRVLDANGTVVAGAWSEPGYFGLSLDEVEAALG